MIVKASIVNQFSVNFASYNLKISLRVTVRLTNFKPKSHSISSWLKNSIKKKKGAKRAAYIDLIDIVYSIHLDSAKYTLEQSFLRSRSKYSLSCSTVRNKQCLLELIIPDISAQ